MGWTQKTLLPELKKQYEHGGDLLKGKRKSRRPFDRQKPLHIVFRSDEARGKFSFLLPHNRRIVNTLIVWASKKWHVKIYDHSINSNHLHLLVRAIDRYGLKGFLRSLAGAVAMAVTGAKKGSKLLRRFWATRVYSRIAEWGRSFYIVRRYIHQNVLEAQGLIPYAPRKGRRQVPRTTF